MKPTLEFIEETHSLRKDYRNIARIFSYGRPAESDNETYYVERFVKNPHLMKLGMTEDNFVYDGKVGGNLFVKIGKNPKILFSCHTDTVDSRNINWFDGRKKEIVLDINTMRIKKKDTTTPCLGADDGTGIWLCWELIKAGVEGWYIFHRAEEVGGRGSSYIANNNSEELEKYDFAIAFDRMDLQSIITQQVGQICASQEFVDSFSEQLGMNHRADPTGSFTDTANYTDYISECTNLSVGYYGAHSGNEQQDLKYVREFRDALLKVDWSKLVAKREPGVLLPEKTPVYTSSAGYGTRYYGGGWGRQSSSRASGVAQGVKKSYNSLGVKKTSLKKLQKEDFFQGYDNYYEKYLHYILKDYDYISDDDELINRTDYEKIQIIKEKIGAEDDILTIKILQLESPNILDKNFIYDDWENFFS